MAARTAALTVEAHGARILASLLLAAACSAPAPTTPPKIADTPVAAAPEPPQPTLDPPPPDGVVIPRGVRPVEITVGTDTTSFYWLAVLAGDPTDSELQARVSNARARGETLLVAEAALQRYLEDVQARGISTSEFAFMGGFDYQITTPQGVLAVFVRVPSNDPHGGRDESAASMRDDAGPYFEITVGPAGG